MSTRCNIHFTNGYTTANIYKHHDGYPDGDWGVPQILKRFFELNEEQSAKTMSGTRFGDPSYLAARFIVFYSQELDTNIKTEQRTLDPDAPLAFTGIGVVNQDAGDAEYVYTVDCDNLDQFGYPTITHREV